MIKSRKRSVKKSGSKRKLNAYFKKMLEAKRNKSASFMYKGKKYVGRSHKRLGMIYKKA
jgi:hypothetical protein